MGAQRMRTARMVQVLEGAEVGEVGAGGVGPRRVWGRETSILPHRLPLTASSAKIRRRSKHTVAQEVGVGGVLRR